MRPLLPLALAALLAAPATADEVWSGDWGRIVWETDIGITAVLLAEGQPGAAPRRLYVEGLTLDVAGRRTTYDGIWTATFGDGGCELSIVDPVSQQPTPYWGTFSITFVQRAFPSAWAGVWGDCTDARLTAFGASPVIGP
jgi:hypothetical protein